MFDVRLLRSDPEAVKKAMQARRADVDIAAILEIDAQRRTLVYEVEQLRARQNRTGEEIAAKKRSGDADATLIEEMKNIKERISRLEDEVRSVDESLRQCLLTLPNLPDERTPAGTGESDNREERRWGVPRTFEFAPRDHVEVGEGLGILDFAAAARLSGARFSLSRGAGALLERALIQLMLDIHTREHGYTEILPPLMVNSQAMQGTGQLPKFAADLFKVEGTDYWLIPTAEVPVTNIHRDEILEESRLPIHYAAYTPCFRSEAGAYGKDTRGMIRVHQFNKVELVKFTTPETSWEELERLTAHAEVILQRLELPYRTVSLCAGDLGFSAAKTYDIEVWLPAQNAYREISSCSNFTDFQARRANIRFRRGKKPEFVHTLNGSGIAVGRAVVAILENCQREDGSVEIPRVLRPYMHGMTRISRA